jgi:hypothetical protein
MDAELYDEIILNTIFPFMSDNRAGILFICTKITTVSTPQQDV